MLVSVRPANRKHLKIKKQEQILRLISGALDGQLVVDTCDVSTFREGELYMRLDERRLVEYDMNMMWKRRDIDEIINATDAEKTIP